ncbi:MAG: hypothetical protein H7287_01820 [Thermoleophilia bacterium]|nr:hypothetical protein [Thermoleophilia bacterium]
MLHATALTDPLLVIGLALGVAGITLAVQARLQVRLLQRRIASGAGTAIIDPSTGLFAEAAAWQCVRAEANRAWRLARPLDIWVGTARDASTFEQSAKALAFDLPIGSMGVRLAEDRVAIVSCTGADVAAALPAGIEWRTRSITASDTTAQHALMFLSEESA